MGQGVRDDYSQENNIRNSTSSRQCGNGKNTTRSRISTQHAGEAEEAEAEEAEAEEAEAEEESENRMIGRKGGRKRRTGGSYRISRLPGSHSSSRSIWSLGRTESDGNMLSTCWFPLEKLQNEGLPQAPHQTSCNFPFGLQGPSQQTRKIMTFAANSPGSAWRVKERV